MRYRRAAVPGASYFFTLITHRRQRLFSDEDNVARWHRAVAKVQRKWPFIVEAEVILPDHLHMIWTMPERDSDFATRIRLVKTAFTKDLNSGVSVSVESESRAGKGELDFWQRRYWEHLIRDERDYKAHAGYIHFNPVKHGLVSSPKDWPHSTFLEWVERGSYDAWWGSDEMPPLPDWAGRE